MKKTIVNPPSFWSQHKVLILVGSATILVGGALTLFYFRRKKKIEAKKIDEPVNVSTPTIASSLPVSTTPAITTPPYVATSPSISAPTITIKYGSKHPDVRILQRYLKSKGQYLGKFGPRKDGIDGHYGRKTLAAAKKVFGKTIFTSSDIQNMKNKLNIK